MAFAEGRKSLDEALMHPTLASKEAVGKLVRRFLDPDRARSASDSLAVVPAGGLSRGRSSSGLNSAERPAARPESPNPPGVGWPLKAMSKSMSPVLKGIAEHAERMDHVAKKRTEEMWTLLEAFRSASADQVGHLTMQADDEPQPSTSAQDWKLKDEGETYRVMYREGPEGTVLHTICLEGVVHGSVKTALALAWEVPFYQSWWPQFSMPQFKITDSKCMKRIRTGNQLAFARFKVPWPFAARELAVSSFEMELVERGLLMVAVGSLPDDSMELDPLEEYGVEDIPPSDKNVVRMGVSGGYTIIQLNPDLSYFRVILDLDPKLDNVPAFVINFVARQLASSGYFLYDKEVELVDKEGAKSKLKDQIAQVMREDPMYQRVASTMAEHIKRREQELQELEDSKRQQDEAASFRMIGEKVEEALNMRTASGSGRAISASASNSLVRSRPTVIVTMEGDAELGVGGPDNSYHDLDQRDPELFDAVSTLDHAIAMLRARNDQALGLAAPSAENSTLNSPRGPISAGNDRFEPEAGTMVVKKRWRFRSLFRSKGKDTNALEYPRQTQQALYSSHNVDRSTSLGRRIFRRKKA